MSAPKVAKIIDSLYIANPNGIYTGFLDNAQIDIIYWLVPPEFIAPDARGKSIMTFSLSNEELLDEEMPRYARKLREIADLIDASRKASGNIVIVCEDGQNISALVAAYYLTRVRKMNCEIAISEIENIYLTDAQKTFSRKTIEQLDISKMQPNDREMINIIRKNRCLANYSHRKILQNISL